MIERRECEFGSQLKEELEHFFYPTDKWPTYILKVLLGQNFRRQERLTLATFFHGNGMHLNELAMRIFKFYNAFFVCSGLWNKRMREFSDLWKHLDRVLSDEISDMKSSYYYYDMQAGHMMFYSGEIRIGINERENFIEYRRKY